MEILNFLQSEFIQGLAGWQKKGKWC